MGRFWNLFQNRPIRKSPLNCRPTSKIRDSAQNANNQRGSLFRDTISSIGRARRAHRLSPARAAEEEKVTLNFVNADIVSVIKAVGAHTGKNFILDPRVTGTVNIVSDKPVPKELLYPMLLSVLRTQGYAAVESNGFVKIVPEAEGKTGASPRAKRREGPRRPPRDARDPAAERSALQLGPVLRPLVTATISSPPTPPTTPSSSRLRGEREAHRVDHPRDRPATGATSRCSTSRTPPPSTSR